MAYASVVSLSQLLDQILDRHQQSFVASHEKQRIESLQDKIVFLTTFLEDFPRDAGSIEARIRNAANKVEDVLEYHILNSGKPHTNNAFNCFRKVTPSLSFSTFSGHNMEKLCKELQKPEKKIDSILKKVMQIKRSRTSEIQSSAVSFPSRRVPDGKDTVVGFEEDLMKIKGRLCGEPPKLQIIPIVGMGGIGKTTLARCALDDPLSVDRFDVRAWVAVSQSYHIHSILLGLLNSIDASTKGTSSDTEVLVESVYKYLKGRRYLVVIDDIWNTELWDDVQRAFPDDLNGSRIMITSRDSDVTSYVVSSRHHHQMHLMAVDPSWRLLKESVFGEEECPPELESIGKLIAAKCGGLPLAIVVIAGVLSKVSRKQEAWDTIARNVNEAVNTSDEPFAEILALSYNNLPHHLRPCFLYMAGFPEDHEISVTKLIRLWVAEGFLKPNDTKDFEELAEEYLEDLAKRSLVLIHKKRYNGKIKTIKIHDLLRDLCLKKARDDKFLRRIDKFRLGGIGNSRRLSMFSSLQLRFPYMDGSRIRTVLLYDLRDYDYWKQFRLLRVLDAMTVTFTSFPDEVGDLLHLRYLALSFPPRNYNVLEVPESWSNLQNLQTLIISNVFALASHLTFHIWRMKQLRHVMLKGFLCEPSGDQVSALENLVSFKLIRSFTCSRRFLELIPNLKKLGIIYSCRQHITGWAKFRLHNLVHLPKLEKLSFSAYPVDYCQSNLSKNIAFPATLKKLALSGSNIPWGDMTIVGSLPNLEVLKLKTGACVGNKWETAEGEFCELRVLLIDSTEPEHWITESCHFPRLQSLLLRNCHILNEIPYSIGEIPTLQLIELDRCSLCLVETAKFIGEEQHSFGNQLKVYVK